MASVASTIFKMGFVIPHATLCRDALPVLNSSGII